MTHHDAFETQLAVAMRDYVSDAPTDVDPVSFARAIALAHPRRSGPRQLFIFGYRYRWLLLAALLAVALVVAIGVGQQLLRRGGGSMLAYESDGDIFFVAPNGPSIVAVQHDSDFRLVAWSPDGRWLVLQGPAGSGLGPDGTPDEEIFLLEAETRRLKKLPGQITRNARFEAWAPDSRHALIRRWEDERTSEQQAVQAIVDVQTGEAEDLDVLLCHPVWSPDGRFIAGVADMTVGVLTIATRAWEEIGGFGGYGCDWSTGWDEPTWSPDSERIAFESAPNGLTVASRDGSVVRQIGTLDSEWPRPRWSPDGEWIAYRRADGLGLVRPDGSGARRLTDMEADRRLVSWSADSSRVEFAPAREDVTSQREIWSVDVATGELERLVFTDLRIDNFARQPETTVAPEARATDTPATSRPPLPTATYAVRSDGTGRTLLTEISDSLTPFKLIPLE